MKKKSMNIIKNMIEILGVIVIAVLINKFIIFTAYIPSESMIPTLNVGDRVLVNRVYNPNNLKRGDVVIFKSNELNEILVKRLIGLPGDEIEFKGTSVYANGKRLEEPYVKSPMEFEGKYKVPSNKYFFEEQDTGDYNYFMSSKYLRGSLSREESEGQDNKYFFLGDNRSNSNDSRSWKDPYISGNDIIGKAQFIIWPLRDIGLVKK